MPKRTFKFLLYAIHGHLADGLPDYSKLAERIIGFKGRYWRDGSRVVAFGAAMLTRGKSSVDRASLIAYSGEVDKSVLFFDLEQQSEINSLLESGRFVARKTRIMFDPRQRILMIEAGRGHLPAEEFAKIVETELQNQAGFEALELSFTPVAAPTFISQIDEMKRIQSVMVSIARPNYGWTDRYDQFNKFADESDAKSIDATVRARRNSSLSKQNGIVPNLKHWLSKGLPSVINAKVRGAFGEGSGLIELKLSDHVETANITTDVKPDSGQPLDSEIQEKLSTYLDQRAESV